MYKIFVSRKLCLLEGMENSRKVTQKLDRISKQDSSEMFYLRSEWHKKEYKVRKTQSSFIKSKNKVFAQQKNILKCSKG